MIAFGRIQDPANLFLWQPKAAAMQWTTRALALESRKHDPSAASICICIREREEDDAWLAQQNRVKTCPSC